MDPNALLSRLQSLLPPLLAWAKASVLNASTLTQLAVLGATLLLAGWLAGWARSQLRRLMHLRWMEAQRELIERIVQSLTLPAAWLVLAWVGLVALQRAEQPTRLVDAGVSLLAAWVTIRFTSLLVRDPVWSKFIAVSAWILATLNILGLLGPTIAVLDGLSVQMGHLRLSALLVIKGVLSLAVFLWLAVLGSQLMERRIRTLPTLTPSIQVLISKLLKIVLITIAVVGALGIMGIDLTAFAVFTGAVGVGVGFGLQKVVSNLVSGVILLLDKSVKPGDVISVGSTYGWINSLGARYVSVITRDGREFLIPNEDLITQQVVNWSYSNNEVRLTLPVGVSYRSDVRAAMRLCLEAAAQTPRVLREPASQCVLRGFGDNSVDLELRIWINDPQNGLANVQSDVFLAVWDKFRAHGVEIPFPQRDVHLQPSARLHVVVEPPDAAPDTAASAPESSQPPDSGKEPVPPHRRDGDDA
ncbi:MAG TPA: mechanosensitive ion channel domain-containing protein [bacterium]|nr:mechanosensitive ion channel domain-containing protein [bacterium]